jgi:hypothetical protein
MLVAFLQRVFKVISQKSKYGIGEQDESVVPRQQLQPAL